MIEALNERIAKLQKNADLARTERDDAHRITDGLRRQNTSDVPATARNPCRAVRDENARLRSSVAECIELLQEGREGWRDTAASTDAVIRAVGQ